MRDLHGEDVDLTVTRGGGRRDQDMPVSLDQTEREARREDEASGSAPARLALGGGEAVAEPGLLQVPPPPLERRVPNLLQRHDVGLA